MYVDIIEYNTYMYTYIYTCTYIILIYYWYLTRHIQLNTWNT